MDTKNIKIELKNKHQEFINSLYHDEVKDLIKTKSYFAGGAIRDLMRDEPPKDYDLFFIDEESVELFKNLVKKEFSLKKTKIGNFNSQTTGVQVITLVSGSPDSVVDTFDFTINQGYYLPQMDLLLKGEVTGILKVCPKLLSPLQALCRVEKFRKKGYDCPMQVLVDLGVAISKMGALNNEADIKKALMGMSFSEVLEGQIPDRKFAAKIPKKSIKKDSGWGGDPNFSYDDIPF